MSSKRMYEFSWELLGDIEESRPNLGNTIRVEVYRLMHRGQNLSIQRKGSNRIEPRGTRTFKILKSSCF